MRAAICGAGIAGLTLAQRLVHHGWDVTVVEQAQGPRKQGYMIDFLGYGYDAAERMGVLPRLREFAPDIDALDYVDARGRRRAGGDYARFAGAVDGRLLSLMRPDLERALREQVPDRAALRYGCSIASLEEAGDLDAGARVVFTDGSSMDVDLLVGADGLHSRVRHLLLGPAEQFVRYLGLHTAAFTVQDAAVRAAVGDRFVLTDTIDRMVGLYALGDGRVAVFTVHRSARPDLPTDPRSAIWAAYASLGWVVPRVLDRCPSVDAIYYDQVAQVIAPTWHRGRVALIGDACGAVSLLAGQGASLAVAGAYVLGEHLAAAPSVPAALASYEAAWRPVVEAKQQVGRRSLEWFLPSTQRRVLLRRAVLRLAAVPGADRLLGRGLVGRETTSLADLADGARWPPGVTAR